MTDPSIFSKNQETEVKPAPVTSEASNGLSVNPVDNLLHSIKNEQGEVKYNSVEDALKGAAHAQGLLSQNKTELTTLAQELNALKVENAQYKGALEAMDHLSQPQQTQTESVPATNTGLDEAGVINLIAQREKKATETANKAVVINKLLEKFGDKAEEIFYSVANKNGLSKELINQIAATSPEAALKYFENENAAVINPIQTSVNSTTPLNETPPLNDALPKSESSMLMGASSQELREEMNRHKAHVYKKFEVNA